MDASRTREVSTLAKGLLLALTCAILVVLSLATMPGEAKAITAQEYWNKTDSFLADPQWANGTSWSQIPSKLSPLTGYAGCWAYANDFTTYVYGIHSYQVGERFSNPSEIRTGDVIRINNSHTFVVIERNGSALRTAEGGFGEVVATQTVRVASDVYSVSGNTLNDRFNGVQSVTEAYHFDTGGATTYQAGNSPRGSIDKLEAVGAGKIRIAGWAIDDDDSNAAVEIHVYIGGNNTTTGEGHSGIVANTVRTDVGSHSFDVTIDTDRRGNVPVYAFGINIGATGANHLNSRICMT